MLKTCKFQTLMDKKPYRTNTKGSKKIRIPKDKIIDVPYFLNRTMKLFMVPSEVACP